MTRLELPTEPGSYRWYYVDATGGGFTAVAIFMIGSLFSPRFGRSSPPQAHAAVNFALYEHGVRRVWVLSEYPKVSLEDGALCIGASTFRYLDSRRLRIDLDEHTAPWGRPFRACLEVESLGPSLAPLQLVEGLGHSWQPIALRSKARLSVPSLQLELETAAYHDGNHGHVPLGTDLPGWEWERVQDSERTVVTYRPWGGPALSVSACSRSVRVARGAGESPKRSRTRWGLPVPRGTLLESSPFYARLESSRGDAHSLGEVADFRRFQSPWIRWMARMRTRLERAA